MTTTVSYITNAITCKPKQVSHATTIVASYTTRARVAKPKHVAATYLWLTIHTIRFYY